MHWIMGCFVLFSQPSSFRLSPLFCHCVIPIGLYSRLANLFAFGTGQTGSLTFTPLRPPLLKSIITEISCRPSDGSQISRKTFFFSLINKNKVASVQSSSQLLVKFIDWSVLTSYPLCPMDNVECIILFFQLRPGIPMWEMRTFLSQSVPDQIWASLPDLFVTSEQ